MAGVGVLLSGGVTPTGFTGRARDRVETHIQKTLPIGARCITCPTCGGQAVVESLTVTGPDGHKRVERWTICQTRKKTKYRDAAASCPIQKEVLEDMGVLADALEGLSVEKIAARAGCTWQAVAKMKGLDRRGKLKESEKVAEVLSAAEQVRNDDIGPPLPKKRSYHRKRVEASPTQEPVSPAVTPPDLWTMGRELAQAARLMLAQEGGHRVLQAALDVAGFSSKHLLEADHE